MATQGREGGKDKYSYSASSFKTKTNEEELFELVQLSDVPVDKELFKVLLEMLKLNIAPVAILQVLKSLKSPQSAVPTTESIKPSKDHSKPASKSTKKSTHTSKEPSSTSQEHKRPTSKHSSRSSQKRTTVSSGTAARKERTAPKS